MARLKKSGGKKKVINRFKDYVTFIAQLLSAISILLGGATYLYQVWIKEPRIQLSVEVVNSTPKLLSLLATNIGGKDVAIRRAFVTNSALRDNLAFPLKIAAAGEIVKKGESLLLIPAASDLSEVVGIDKALAKGDQAMCTATVEYVGPNGKPKVATAKFQCYAACIVENPLMRND